MKKPQKTIETACEYVGTGLHTGERVTIRFKPAPPNSGVVFVRTDLPGFPRVPVHVENASFRLRRTSILKDGVEINTTEHLLASLAGIGIDNLEIEIDGGEVPGCDGSARIFLELLQNAGYVEQPMPKKSFAVTEPISVSEGKSLIIALPFEDGLSVSYTLDYSNPYLGSQYCSVVLNDNTFATEIAPARTFCLSSEVDDLRDLGLGRGATYQNTLVIGENGVIDNELRFPDEFVRHKILDLMGDLFLVEADLCAHIVAIRSGHPLNVKLVERIRRIIQEEERKATRQKQETLDIREIQRILPHRYPFLLVDRVLEVEGDRRVRGIKNITFNEDFFQGHFPGQPVMPGVLQIEAMAQLAGVLLLRRCQGTNQLAVLFSIDKAKIRRPVVPGDQLLMEAQVTKSKPRLAEVTARATVDGQIASEADLKFMLVREV